MRMLLLLLLGLMAGGQVMAQDEPDEGEPELFEEAVFPLGPEHDIPAESLEPSDPIEMEWLRAEGFDRVVCPFRGRIDYEPGEIECGLIKVPENREVADSRTIELHFVHLHATGKDHEDNDVQSRNDPVIYLTGGPGVTVEGYVKRLKDHRLLARRDLYILEQRGIGYSGDFCPFFMSRNRADQIHPDQESSERAFYDMAETCIAGAKAQGVDVTGYNTFENARDIKALRLALNLDDWNLWGISYGSVLGQAYMKVDPEGIRAAVIDAIVPLNIGELMRLPYWHDANLTRLFEACAAQSDCARVFGGLRERYMAAIRTMNESPVRVEVEASEMFPQGEVYFFANLLAGLPFSLMYEQETHPALPAIIDGLTRVVESNDDIFFRALAGAMSEGAGVGGFEVSMGMSVAVRCQDGYVDAQARDSIEDFRLFPELAQAFGHPTVIAEGPERCQELGLEARDSADYEPVQTDLPVIVANGRWDPVTPVPLAEAIMPGFENGQLIVFPHAGHGPTRSIECAGDWLNDWFDDPTQPAGRDCVDEGEQSAEFLAPYFPTDVVVQALALRSDNEDRLKAHAIWAGSSAGIALFAALVLPMAWVGRRFNGHYLDPAGGSRLLVFLATLLASAWLIGLGAAAYVTSEITEVMLLFGLVPWAMGFAWLGPLSVLIAILALMVTWRRRIDIRLASRIGLLLSSLAVISLGLAGFIWSLWPV